MARQDRDDAVPTGLTPDQMNVFLELQRRALELQEQQASALKLQEERSRPRENANYVASSVFLKPSGEPWASDLKCLMYFGPILLNKTPLTEAEVVALNRIQPVEKALLRKVDGSDVKVTVRPTENAVGELEKLTIELPMRKEDNAQHYPPLTDLARQLAAAGETVAA